jgi:hypothetical protein
VKPVKGWNQRHRGRKLAAGQRWERKELTRGDCGSVRRLAAARSKVSAVQEWHGARGTSSEIMDQSQGWARNPESTDAQEEGADAPRRQKGSEGHRQQTAAMSEEVEGNHERHRRVGIRTAVATGKRRNAQEEPVLGFQREGRQRSSRNFQWVTRNSGLDIGERSAPSEAEKEAAHGVRAGYMGASASPGLMVHRRKNGENKETFGWWWLIGIYWHVSSEPLRASGLMNGAWLIGIYWHVNSEPLRANGLTEGAVGALGEWTPRKKKRLTCRKTLKAHTSEINSRRSTDTLLETSGLKEENCNRFDQRVARQQLYKHGPTRTNRWGPVFYVVRAEQRWIMGLSYPFLRNGSVNTFPRIGPCYECGDVINRNGVFRGSMQNAYKRREWQFVGGSCESVVNWRSEPKRVLM